VSDEVVIVPRAPGPLVRPEAGGRRGDDLDDLIDDLLPDTDEGPGLVDAGLLAGGAGLLAWSVLGTAPDAATIAGIAAVGLGSILPLRAGWRWVAERRHRALLRRGTPLLVRDPVVARLVAAYEELATGPEAARAAAHAALQEVASLLAGRAPASERERGYVTARAEAVEDLAAAVAELESPQWDDPTVDPDLVVEAREELDAIGGMTSLSRLDELTTEMRARGRRR
jgi:hypothetical protein